MDESYGMDPATRSAWLQRFAAQLDARHFERHGYAVPNDPDDDMEAAELPSDPLWFEIDEPEAE